ncbi:MAG TPA: glycosyl hydrolase family 18 protein [Candidatus Limnocylindrales bacterium]
MIDRSHVRTALLGLVLSAVLVVGLVGSASDRTDQRADLGSSASPTASSDVVPSPSPLSPDQVVHRPTEVFGFLPYWSMADWTDGYLRYDLLTTIAFFGVGVRQNGTLITSGAGYDALLSPRAATIIEHAHANGVRVVVTFESFGVARNHKFLASVPARTTFVTEASAFVAAHGLDGLNLDIEGLDGVDRPAFGLLAGATATAIHAADPASEISVAVNGNVSGARMAQIALAAGVDRAFLMGYAYRVAASPSAGAIAPFSGIGTPLDLVKSLDLFEANKVPAERIILGLPYYGMTWPTLTDELHAARQPDKAGFGRGVAFRPRTIVASGPPAGSTLDYDLVEQVARLTWFDAAKGTWYQTYYDDPATLAPKEHLAVERGLAGVGIWALGDDAGQPGYWETIAATLDIGSPGGSPAPGASASPSASPSPFASPSRSASPSSSASPSASPSTAPPSAPKPSPSSG